MHHSSVNKNERIVMKLFTGKSHILLLVNVKYFSTFISLSSPNLVMESGEVKCGLKHFEIPIEQKILKYNQRQECMYVSKCLAICRLESRASSHIYFKQSGRIGMKLIFETKSIMTCINLIWRDSQTWLIHCKC